MEQKLFFMAVERRADQSKCYQELPSWRGHRVWDVEMIPMTQELRTGWPLAQAVKIPLNMGVICLKVLPLCAEGPVVGAFGDCPFWAGEPTWLLTPSQAASVRSVLPFFPGLQRPVADVQISPVRDSGPRGTKLSSGDIFISLTQGRWAGILGATVWCLNLDYIDLPLLCPF